MKWYACFLEFRKRWILISPLFYICIDLDKFLHKQLLDKQAKKQNV
jgi:hypothetical protein